jgi:hypothetical protein
MKDQIYLIHIKHISICTGMTLLNAFTSGQYSFRNDLPYGAQRALVWGAFQMAGMELTGGSG